ncbi:YidC/Oxa1 family membrane protein insertase [Formivibrio citricus]|uniref:Membrane protein insertase YidC n=1 Tax=Formivibrio citricus TaxID=83765 RepID=A0A1I5CSP3_9NEIS|nr:membrane protein insertase YidC [Formivibrio citricus]SFN89954.1 YidC/Oxa1 family membrane protein insertase [Formivibrio citricus]
MDTEKKRLIFFALIAVAMFFGWEYVMNTVFPERATRAKTPAPVTASAPAVQGGASDASAKLAVQDGAALARGQRVSVKTDLFAAEIDSNGADLRRVELLKHGASGEPGKNFVLLQDDGQRTYVAQTGLIGDGLPSHKTEFKAAKTAYQLAEGQNELAVRLEAAGPDGVKVAKTYLFKRGSYVVDVKYEIANASDKPVSASAYYRFLRDGVTTDGGTFGSSTFTGPAVYTSEGKFQKVEFADIDKKKAKYVQQSKDGWVAMLQHYFATAWVVSPVQGASACAVQECRYELKKLPEGLYSAGVIVDLPQVAAGAKSEATMPLFLGPEETRVIKNVAPGLDLVKDYGWVTVIASPLFMLLDMLHQVLGNWGWAIIVLTVLIKAAFYPLSAASYRSMAKMRLIQPRMEQLKERCGDDRVKLQQAMMELYKTEKINPLGGCLPILVQIPVFIALYWALLASVELRQAPWLGWITDLSVRDPYYVLPILMAISMYVQSLMSPPPPDPVQAKIMKAMPLVFSIMFLTFPAGLVLYWIVNNTLSIVQQWMINRTADKEGVASLKS